MVTAEQRLFARMAVFSGGSTLDAAEEVAGAELDTLQSLVDKSLLRRTGDRFWMLETTREYAAEQLDDSGETAALERSHAEYFLALAEEAAPNLRWSGSAGDWLDRLERDHDNLRAALDRLRTAGEGQPELQLAGALSRFWIMRGHLAEGGRRLESALATDERPTAARARALNGAAVVAMGDDVASAKLHTEEALAIHRTLGDSWGTAYSALILGELLGEEGDLVQARELIDEGRRRFIELGDDYYTLMANDCLAGVHRIWATSSRRARLHEDNLSRARAQSNWRLVLTGARSAGAIRRRRRTSRGGRRNARGIRWHSPRPRRSPRARRTELRPARAHPRRRGEGRHGRPARVLFRGSLRRDRLQRAFRDRQAKRRDARPPWERSWTKPTSPRLGRRGRSLTLDEAVALALES